MTFPAFLIVSAVFVQAISAQCISNMFGQGMIGNSRAINMENMAMNFGPMPYQANNFYAPANALPYDGIYGPATPLAYDGIYGPANPLAYDGIYGPASPLVFDGLNQGLTLASLAASNCKNFAVKSSSLITPTGVSLQSENLVIEGPLAVNGQLPFLGTISLEGALPAAGNGAVAYGCGNGNIAITNEDLPLAGPMGYMGAPGYGPGLPPLGPYNYNAVGRGIF